MATQTPSGWYITGYVRSHAAFAADPQACRYSPLPHVLYEDKAAVEKVRDHFLYGPYDCVGVRIAHTAGTLAALASDAYRRDLIESAARLTEDMTADEMDAMEREIEAERATLDADAADERRDEALWRAEQRRIEREREAERRARELWQEAKRGE